MNNINFDFSKDNVLVIGGSKGIGKEVCNLFSLYGAKNIYSIARTSSNNDNVKSLICDITDTNCLLETFSLITDEINILINVAGTNLCEPIENITVDEWDRVNNTNLKSFFMSTKYFSSKMKKMKRGKIVNVASIAGRHKSIVSGIHYTSSKYGVIGLTKQSAHELGPYGINVNCTCPSQTMTEMLKKSMSKTQIKKLSQNIPIRRISTVTEQAMPILFLCTQAANYIHGATIDVNGGQF